MYLIKAQKTKQLEAKDMDNFMVVVSVFTAPVVGLAILWLIKALGNAGRYSIANTILWVGGIAFMTLGIVLFKLYPSIVSGLVLSALMIGTGAKFILMTQFYSSAAKNKK